MIVCYALLVDLGYEKAPLEDGVYCFGTQEEAEKFAIDALVASGEYTRTECGVYDNKELGKSYSDAYDALEAFQDGLSFSDYFHIREVKRLPETSPGGEIVKVRSVQWNGDGTTTITVGGEIRDVGAGDQLGYVRRPVPSA